MKKLTIVKIGDETYNPTNEELEKININQENLNKTCKRTIEHKTAKTT